MSLPQAFRKSAYRSALSISALGLGLSEIAGRLQFREEAAAQRQAPSSQLGCEGVDGTVGLDGVLPVEGREGQLDAGDPGGLDAVEYLVPEGTRFSAGIADDRIMAVDAPETGMEECHEIDAEAQPVSSHNLSIYRGMTYPRAEEPFRIQ